MTPDGWDEADGRLRRELRFGNFSEAWAFMSRVALQAPPPAGVDEADEETET